MHHSVSSNKYSWLHSGQSKTCLLFQRKGKIIQYLYRVLVCSCFVVPCLSSKVAHCMWMLGLYVRWISQARLKTARASSTLCDSRYWVYWTTHTTTCYTEITHTHSQRLYDIYTHTSLSHPEPELLVQSAGDEAALKEDANPVVVLGDRSILWFFLRLGRDLWPLCGCLGWI